MYHTRSIGFRLLFGGIGRCANMFRIESVRNTPSCHACELTVIIICHEHSPARDAVELFCSIQTFPLKWLLSHTLTDICEGTRQGQVGAKLTLSSEVFLLYVELASCLDPSRTSPGGFLMLDIRLSRKVYDLKYS